MAQDDDRDVNRKSGLAYSAALALFFAVASFTGLGWLGDKYFKTDPWLLVAGVVLGSIIGFYQFFRLISKLS